MVSPPNGLPQVSDADLFDTIDSASSDGNLDGVRSLLPRLRTISTDIANDMQELLRSASYPGHIQTIRFLLAEGSILLPHVPARVALALSWSSPTDEALPLFKTFLNLGWDVNTKLPRYGNSLRHALVGNNFNLVKLLVDNGADVNEETKTKYESQTLRSFGSLRSTRPLSIAALCCSSDYLQLLLDHGARLEDCALLHKIASRNVRNAVNSIPNLEFLLQKGVDIDAIEPSREDESHVAGTALQYAAARGNVAIVRFLLGRGADVTIIDTGEYGTALEWAQHPVGGDPDEDNDEVVRLLTEAGKAKT